MTKMAEMTADQLRDIIDRSMPADAADELRIGMNHLMRAVTALGFDRARDVVTEYGDDGDPNQADWHPAFIDMVHTAIGVAQDAAGEDGFKRWLAFGPDAGQCVRWAWRDEPDAEFAGLVLRSVHGLLGTDETKPAYVEALRRALPVMRRTAAEYLSGVMVNGDPSTITPTEWQEIAPDLDAIVAAEACVGRLDAAVPCWMDGLSQMLDAILDDKRWRKHVGDADA